MEFLQQYNTLGMATTTYCSATTRAIRSLDDLVPGDHVRVGTLIKHHMLVVKVVSESTIRVIHKMNATNAVLEENETYTPEEITVIVYECEYTGQDAIDRARARIGEDYNLFSSNCEHFVTEVRTGTPKSIQIETASNVGMILAVGAGLAAGAGIVYGLSRMFKKDRDTQ